MNRTTISLCLLFAGLLAWGAIVGRGPARDHSLDLPYFPRPHEAAPLHVQDDRTAEMGGTVDFFGWQ
jgi:hypothetical protein